MAHDSTTPARPADASYDARPEAKFTWCSDCRSAIRGHYYAVNERPVCAKCKPPYSHAMVRGEGPGSFARALGYGGGAAVISALGLAIVWSFISFGRIALIVGVGIFVGKAIMKATGEYYMRRYQVMAVLLTYLAIATASIAPVIREMATYEPPPAVAADSVAAEEDFYETTPYAGLEDSMMLAMEAKKAARDSARAEMRLGADVRAGRALAVASLPGKIMGLLLNFLIVPMVSMLAFGLYGAAVGMMALGFSMHRAWTITSRGVVYSVSGPHRVGTGPVPQTN